MPLTRKPGVHSVGQRNDGGAGILPAFLHPAPVMFRRQGTTRNRQHCVCVVDSFSSVGIPMLDIFKGVVIGPTINEIAAALAGGTVGVMGTIIVLEAGRQKAKERKQCPYCRTSYTSHFSSAKIFFVELGFLTFQISLDLFARFT